MPTNFAAAEAAVKAATSFEDLLYGEDPVAVHRAFAKLLHPDAQTSDGRKRKATKAFARLGVLWDEHNGKTVAASSPTTISTKKRTYVLDDSLIHGDIANLYRASYTEDGVVKQALLKMPRSAKDNDLMEREAKALKALDAATTDYRMYAPTLTETFRHRDAATKTVRRVNVIEPLDGFYTLYEIQKMFPLGLDPRHVAWIWRRLFVAIGLAFDNDMVHGAVTPANVMIHPINHGVVLLDWCYSCTDGQAVPAIPSGADGMYPQSVFDKEPPTFALDVRIAAASMLWLAGGDARAPRQYKAFARGCSVSSPPKPSELLSEFDELIDDMFGPRKYRKLVLPA